MVPLWVCIDVSGSMAEGGKRFIARNAVRTIEQYVRFGYGQSQVKFLSVSSAVNEIDWNCNEEYPNDFMTANGSFDAKALIDYLRDKKGNVIIVSDLVWDNNSTRLFNKFLKANDWPRVKLLKIGADYLREKSLDYYKSEDILHLLDDVFSQENS